MIKKIQDNLWMLYFKRFGSCVYYLNLKGKRLLIDTSSLDARKELLDDLEELKLSPEKIDVVILTHNHWDHTENLDLFKKAKVYRESDLKDHVPGFPELKVIRTPGHTPDSICLSYKDILFSGDTLFFDGGVGRTDLPGGSREDLLNSLRKLKKEDYKILCPGHV